VYVLYMDDSILAGPDSREIEGIIQEIKSHKLDITVLGDVNDFLGVNITKIKDGKLHVSKLHLIQQIIKQTHMLKATSNPTPAKSVVILHRQRNLPSYTPLFNYKSVIGKLNYLERGTRSDISYATHQCVRWLVRYLIRTKDKRYIINLKSDRGLEVHVDTNFSRN